VRVFLRREVAAERLRRGADGVRDAVDDLAHAGLAARRVSLDAGFAEVLGNDDVRRELRPRRRDLRAFHLEDHGAVRVRDRAPAALPDHALQRSLTGDRVPSLEGDALLLLVRGGALAR